MFKSMKKICLILCVGFISINAFASIKPVLDIHHWQMKNGAQVYFVQTQQLPMLDIRLVFAAGSSRDDSLLGLASMTNSLIGEGSEHLTANQIAEKFDSVGAAFSVQAGRDQASISLRTLTKPSFFDAALNTFIEVATHPSFTADSIVRAKNSAYSVIKSQQQDPGAVANNLFYAATFKDSPYAHPSVGTVEKIAEITREKMTDFYHQYYVAKNMKIILVGNISLSQANTIADEISKPFPSGQVAPSLSLIPDTQKGAFLKSSFPAAQTSLVVGEVGITRNNPDYFPLMLGNSILGGASETSLLYEILRNKHGLVYFANSQFVPMQYRGPFEITLKTKNQQATQALDLIKKISNDYIKSGPTAAQLIAAKKNVIGRFPLQLSTNANILDTISAMAFYDLPLTYLDTYRDNIAAVSSSDIKKAFAKHIKPDNYIVVSVGGDSEKK
jgi:zinc protease